MPAPVTDGTVVQTGSAGDLVSDEDMTAQPRLSPLVPQLGATNAGYKIERTKLVVGDYDTDRGDISSDGGRPLPVETFVERRFMEAQYLRATELASQLTLGRRHAERAPVLFFARTGRDGRI
jgi:hypothetical protein